MYTSRTIYNYSMEHRYCHSALGGSASCAELYAQLCTILTRTATS